MSKKSVCLLFVFFLVVGNALFFASLAHAQASTPRIEILNDSLSVTTSAEKDAKNTVVVTIRNNGPALKGLTLRVANMAQEVTAPVIISPDSIDLAENAVEQIAITFSSVTKTQSGYLVLEGKGVASATCPLTITPAVDGVSILFFKNVKPDVGKIITGGFLIGWLLLFLLALAVVVYKKSRPSASGKWRFNEILSGRMMAELDWDFSKNWGATFTLLGAFFVTLGGAALMPKTPQLLSGQSYQVVIIAGPALIALAPMVVAALNSLGRELTFTTEKEKTIHMITIGADAKLPVLILPYLAGSAFVTWAVTVELVTLLIYLRELELAQAISSEIAGYGQIGIALLWLIGFYYSLERIVYAAMTAEKKEAIIEKEKKKYEDSLKDPNDWLSGLRSKGVRLYSESRLPDGLSMLAEARPVENPPSGRSICHNKRRIKLFQVLLSQSSGGKL